MADDRSETAEEPQGSVDTPELSRKERAAARRAEFESRKAAKDAEKAATKAAALEEKLAARKAREDDRAAAKAAKEAAKAAKKAAKTSSVKELDVESGAPADEIVTKEKKEKKEKDPYRPRFAVAPGKVRAFTIAAAVLAIVHVAAAVVLFAAAYPTSPARGAASGMLVGVAAVVLLVGAILWTASAALLCAGRVLGKHLGVAALVFGFPLSLVAAPLLLSADVRDWAL